MDNILKYILLYAVFILSLFGLFRTIDDWYSKNVEIQQNILIKQAQTHFNNQINTREWNSKYCGVFVKQVDVLFPKLTSLEIFLLLSYIKPFPSVFYLLSSVF